MSDLAGCFAANAVRPDGLVPRNRLVAEFDPSDRSANSAETASNSLVIGEPEATNSRPKGLGRLFGYCATARTIFDVISPTSPRTSMPPGSRP